MGNATEPTLSDADRAELEALRAEVARLRARTPGAPPPTDGSTGSRAARTWRWVACGLLLTFMALLLLGSVAARFVRSELLDTDRYVATVAPIGNDPAIQDQLVTLATDSVMNGLQVEARTTDLLTALAEGADRLPPRVAQELPELAPMIAGAAEDLVRKEVTKLVTSPEFETFWINANRAAHKNLRSVLTGEGETVLQSDANGTVTLSLGPVIEQVKQRLVDRGLSFAERIPALDPTFTVFQSDDIVKLQRVVALLDRAADVLPLLAVACGALAVLVAPRGRRRGAVTLVGLVAAATMVLLGLGVNIGRALYLNAVPSEVLTPSSAVAVIDPILEPLRWMLRAVLVLGLVVAATGYLTGSTRSARAVRRGTGALVAKVRGTTRVPSPFEVWVGRFRRPLQVSAVVLGALVLVSWQYPSGVTVAWIALVTGLAVLVIYLLGAPQRVDGRAPAGTSEADRGDEPPAEGSEVTVPSTTGSSPEAPVE